MAWLPLLALCPFVAAAGLMLARWRLARTRAVRFALLFGLATLLAAAPLIAPSHRVVLIFDDAGAACRNLPMLVPDELRPGGVLPVSACQGVAIRQRQRAAAEGGQADCASPDGPRTSWAAECTLLDAPGLSFVDTPQEALGSALATLERRGPIRAALDGLLQRRARVVVVTTLPSNWASSVNASSQAGHPNGRPPLDVGAVVQRLGRMGAVLDVVSASDHAAATAPMLSIRPNMSFIPVVGEDEQRFTFDLEVSGVSPEERVSEMRRSCVLAGDCLGNAECGPGTTCAEGVCRYACRSDVDCPRGRTCEAGVCAAPPDKAPLVLGDAATPSTMRQREGAHVLATAQSISLAAFQNASRQVERGWHVLRCRAEVTFDGPGQRRLIVEATEFLPAREGLLYVVWGEAKTFDLQPRSVKRSAQPVDALAISEFISGRNALSDAVTFGGNFFEEALLANAKETEPDCMLSGRDDLRCVKPSVLLMHDVRPEVWKAYCEWLTKQMDNGMTLVVSGLPADATSCPLLPLYADAIKYDGRPAKPIIFDRRPQVTLLGDPSRIGRLRYKADLAATGSLTFDGPTLALRVLQDGLEVQREIARRVADELDYDFESKTGEVTPRQSPAFLTLSTHDLAQAPSAGITRADLAERSSIRRRVREAFALASTETGLLTSGRLGVEDVVVIFTYDISEPENASAEPSAPVAELLSRGAHVVLIPLRLPEAYATLVNAEGGKGEVFLQDASQRGSGRLLALKNRNRRLHILTPAGFQAPGGVTGGISLDAAKVDADIDTIVKELVHFLRQRQRANGMQIAVSGLGRFIDERVLPPGAMESPDRPVRVAGGAPLLFQRLLPKSGDGRVHQKLFETVDSRPGVEDAVDPVPLAYGAILGRGHALFLGYSIFEGGFGDFTYPGLEWGLDPKARLFVAGAGSTWGARRVVEAGELTAQLEHPPAPQPRLTRVFRDASSPSLQFEVKQHLDDGAPSDALLLSPVPPKAVDDEPSCDLDGEEVKLRLSEIAPQRNAVLFELSPRQRQRLCGGASCLVQLCRQLCESAECPPATPGDRLFLPPESPGESADETRDLGVLPQLQTVARYSGGSDADAMAVIPVQSRPGAALALLLSVATLWLIAGARRLFARRRAATEVRRTVAQAKEDATTGLVHQAGEAQGPPATALPAGTFAGFRLFEPGDRLKGAVLVDVALMSGLAGSDTEAIIPRVVQRVDERSRRVRLIVNAGASLRTPGTDGLGPKLLAAGRVCDLLADFVYAARGELVLELVATHQPVEPFGPHRDSPGPEALTRHLCDQRWISLAGWAQGAPLVAEVEGESIIYVSDFLNEDLEALAQRAADLEADGSAVGFIAIRAKEERLLTGTAFHARTGMLLDRTGWTSEDMAAGQSEHAEHVRRHLADVRGGVFEVDAALASTDLLDALKDSLLVKLVR